MVKGLHFYATLFFYDIIGAQYTFIPITHESAGSTIKAIRKPQGLQHCKLAADDEMVSDFVLKLALVFTAALAVVAVLSLTTVALAISAIHILKSHCLANYHGEWEEVLTTPISSNDHDALKKEEKIPSNSCLSEKLILYHSK